MDSNMEEFHSVFPISCITQIGRNVATTRTTDSFRTYSHSINSYFSYIVLHYKMEFLFLSWIIRDKLFYTPSMTPSWCSYQRLPSKSMWIIHAQHTNAGSEQAWIPFLNGHALGMHRKQKKVWIWFWKRTAWLRVCCHGQSTICPALPNHIHPPTKMVAH